MLFSPSFTYDLHVGWRETATYPPLLEAVTLGQGKAEGLAPLNQALMRELPSCWRVFGVRAHFSASLPLLAIVKMCP